MVVALDQVPAGHGDLTPPVQKYPAPHSSVHAVDLLATDQVPAEQALQVVDAEAVVAFE